MPLTFALHFPPSGFSFLLRGQSSNVRSVCCWREVVSIGCDERNGGGVFSPVIGPTYDLTHLRLAED